MLPRLRTFQARNVLHRRRLKSTNQEPSEATKPSDTDKESNKDSKETSPSKSSQTYAERDAELMQKFREREGSLANSAFEDGEIEHGLRRNVKKNMFRVI